MMSITSEEANLLFDADYPFVYTVQEKGLLLHIVNDFLYIY